MSGVKNYLLVGIFEMNVKPITLSCIHKKNSKFIFSTLYSFCYPMQHFLPIFHILQTLSDPQICVYIDINKQVFPML